MIDLIDDKGWAGVNVDTMGVNVDTMGVTSMNVVCSSIVSIKFLSK